MSKNPNPELYRLALYLLVVVSTAFVGLLIWIVREFFKNSQKNTIDLEVLKKDVKLLRDDHNKNHPGGKNENSKT